jgi:hypothetical protein
LEAIPGETELNYFNQKVGTNALAAGGETAVSEKVLPQ